MVKTSPSNAGGACSIPGRGAKIPYASQPKKEKNQNIKQKQYCNKFNKDFKKNFFFLIPDVRDFKLSGEVTLLFVLRRDALMKGTKMVGTCTHLYPICFSNLI